MEAAEKAAKMVAIEAALGELATEMKARGMQPFAAFLLEITKPEAQRWFCGQSAAEIADLIARGPRVPSGKDVSGLPQEKVALPHGVEFHFAARS